MGSDFSFKNFGNETGNLMLSRQPSVYSLTFDEFQNTMGEIGKDFGSMNMDELLKNIWSAEEIQSMNSTLQVGSVSTNGVLQKQSSITLPRKMSLKTVDEVWRNMSKEFNDGTSSNMPKNPTLGEVTLEEFLFRAGVVREDVELAANPTSSSAIFGDLSASYPNQNLGFEYQQQQQPNMVLMGGNLMENSTQIPLESASLPLNINGVAEFPQQNFLSNQSQQPQLFFDPNGIKSGKVEISDQISNGNFLQSNVVQGGGMGMGIGGLGGREAVTVAAESPVIPMAGTGKSNGGDGGGSYVTPVPYVFSGSLRGKKSSVLEKVVERRQRRMIKNRESAARSRARKQAYTVELEAEVAKLKEENKQLRKKQVEIMHVQKKQVSETTHQQHGAKRRNLRRTQRRLVKRLHSFVI